MIDKLPIGSIITLKNNSIKYMIVGKKVIVNNVKYDYMCVEYPFGFLKEADVNYVMSDNVDKWFFLGNVN